MIKRFAFALSASFALAGCSGIDHAEIDGTTSMPDTSSFSLAGGTLTTGVATAFTPRVWTRNWHGGSDEESSGIDVQSSNTSVIGVAHVTDDRRVIVYGVGPGQATVDITLNGEVARSINVTVVDPPEK